MKASQFLLILFVFPEFVFGQAIKSTLALQGGSAKQNGTYVSYTIGHVVAGGTFSVGKSEVIQGFEYMLKKNKVKNDPSMVITNEQIQLYVSPNPFIHFITIEGESLEYPLEFNVFDVLGRLIIKRKINDVNENRIDLSELSQAKYFIQLKSRMKKFSTVLIKK